MQDCSIFSPHVSSSFLCLFLSVTAPLSHISILCLSHHSTPRLLPHPHCPSTILLLLVPPIFPWTPLKKTFSLLSPFPCFSSHLLTLHEPLSLHSFLVCLPLLLCYYFQSHLYLCRLALFSLYPFIQIYFVLCTIFVPTASLLYTSSHTVS